MLTVQANHPFLDDAMAADKKSAKCDLPNLFQLILILLL
jgi:hypothetical protein